MSAGAAPVVAEWSGVTPLVPLFLAAAAPSLGCILWLKAHRTERVREEHPGPPEPDVDAVIAVFIEAGQTADGLADVRSLRFPPPTASGSGSWTAGRRTTRPGENAADSGEGRSDRNEQNGRSGHPERVGRRRDGPMIRLWGESRRDRPGGGSSQTDDPRTSRRRA